MLGDVAGLRVLDLGCGEGGYARELARRGATVAGVDGSPRLIEIARARTRAAGLDVRFLVANASALDELDSAAFDLVVASMSLMDVENYAGSVAEAHRVLRGGGALVMSITHPVFFGAGVGVGAHGVGRHRRVHGRPVLDRAVWPSAITPRFRAPVLRRHRPLEDYMMAPLESGFALEAFREPGVTDEELERSHRFRKLARIPYLLFLRWRKP